MENRTSLFPLILIRAAGLPAPESNPYRALLSAWAKWRLAQGYGRIKLNQTLEQFQRDLDQYDGSPFQKALLNTRRALKKMVTTGEMQEIKIVDELKNGQPAYLDALLAYNQAAQQAAVALNNLEQVYNQTLILCFQEMQTMAGDPVLQRALLFASHDLLKNLPAFQAKNAIDFTKKERQTALSLLQYSTRAQYKTTPLSRFATVGQWRLAANEEDELPDFAFDEDKIAIIANVALLPALYQLLLKEPAFYRAQTLLLNPSIGTNNADSNSFLFFDGESECIQTPASNPVLNWVKNYLLERRKITFAALLAALQDNVEAEETALVQLILELVDIGLLEWDFPEKGLQSGWAGSLYNYLGFLPSSTRITDTAFLLQWLRTAARAMPYQSVPEAAQTQRDAVEQITSLFEKYGEPAPELPPERVFFEDVEQKVNLPLPEETLGNWSAQLRTCWQQSTPQQLPLFRSQLLQTARQLIPENGCMDFQDFCLQFMQLEKVAENLEMPAYFGKIGALLQPFIENGRHKAVVNALFPGGGKLFARWLHLFPDSVREQLSRWWPEDYLQFPWHGWTNANFQPLFAKDCVACPDGRLRARAGAEDILLADLELRHINGQILVFQRDTERPIRLIDIGLEAVATKPPTIQILWNLTTPYVSLEAITRNQAWITGTGWRMRPRVEQGDLVLARQCWMLEPTLWQDWLNLSPFEFWKKTGLEFEKIGVPICFFGRISGERPQYFDMVNPLTILLLQKELRSSTGPLLITELLPAPDQYIAEKNGLHAAEIALEFE